MTEILVDSSFLYALFNAEDSRHVQGEEFATAFTGTSFIPDGIIPETGFLFRRDFGYFGVQQFFAKLAVSEVVLVSLVQADLNRVHEITSTYNTARFDPVDCCIMALAERLNVTRIATFDRRDFAIFRPAHCDYFELLPA